jgi:ADP-dependent phosphofructokinase/glucokinase
LLEYVPEGKGQKIDIHLAIEYAEGDQLLGGRFTAPRSNRFYFVHDPNGGKLRQLEIYHSVLDEIDVDVRRHMFGGY